MRDAAVGALACAGTLWLAAAPPAAGDWLVMRDGSRVETAGSWELRGRQVVFTLPNGTLSSLRADEVDLEASERATAASRAEKDPPSEESERPPVLVLTNDDIPRGDVAPPGEPSEPAAEGGADPAPEAPDPASPEQSSAAGVEVTSWNADPSEDIAGLEIAGVVRNSGSDIVANVTVSVTLVDEEGETLLETDAFLQSPGIAPGRSTTFRALAPGIVQLVADPVFEVRAVAVTSSAVSSPAGSGENSGDGGENSGDGEG